MKKTCANCAVKSLPDQHCAKEDLCDENNSHWKNKYGLFVEKSWNTEFSLLPTIILVKNDMIFVVRLKFWFWCINIGKRIDITNK